MSWPQYCCWHHTNYYLQRHSMTIKIIAFGQIAEITGKEFFVDANDMDNLKFVLNIQFPALAEKKYAVAVNKKLVSDNVILTENDTVALMPPYSGG
jgi:molybdopterin synthase sulfur carrier subunit